LSKKSTFSLLLRHEDTLSVTGNKISSTLTFVRLATIMLLDKAFLGMIS